MVHPKHFNVVLRHPTVALQRQEKELLLQHRCDTARLVLPAHPRNSNKREIAEDAENAT